MCSNSMDTCYFCVPQSIALKYFINIAGWQVWGVGGRHYNSSQETWFIPNFSESTEVFCTSVCLEETSVSVLLSKFRDHLASKLL